MKLVITEKPSVAQAVAKVIGAYKREDGYIEGSGYIVSWCVGHLVELAQPQDYDDKYEKWRFADLPILPEVWKTVVSSATKKQYGILKKLMHREDVEAVVNACDAGREGEAIFRMVYEKAGCKKPMLRLWVSSMEDTAIRTGFENLRPGSEYDRLYCAASSRNKADWLVGINGTRLFTTQYGKKLTVGRVQTPTLAMLVARKEQIDNFKKEAYYKVHISGDGYKLTAEEQMDNAVAKVLADKCNGKNAVITKAENIEKTTKPPKLYDLTTLQREANRYFGYTAKQTLDYTQKLYEAKLVTYPRTDSQYLTEDMERSTLAIVSALLSQMPFAVKVDFTPDIRHAVDNKKVSDHHAIIPTMESTKTNIKSCSIEERSIYYLIAQRLLCASAETMRYSERTVTAECEGTEFTAKGKTIIHNGWTAIEEAFSSLVIAKKKKDEEDELMMIPKNAKEGKTISSVTSDVTEHFTSPPKPYTEDTLLSAMERAGSREFDKDTEKKGLGTPATRASIIEKLVSAGYATRKGKQITASDDAANMIEILPEVITSTTLTAEWENKLLQMEKGIISEQEFMDSITELVKKLVSDYSNIGEDAKRIFAEDSKTESLGICPRCGNAVAERKLSYCCMAKGCDFVLWKDNKFMQSIGLNFTKKVAAALVSGGGYIAKNLTSKKTGNKYSAKITLAENGGKYPAYQMELLQERKKGAER